jgi:hypothetical protein
MGNRFILCTIRPPFPLLTFEVGIAKEFVTQSFGMDGLECCGEDSLRTIEFSD